jgi:eukaryotic-like serine/threonine-protein kinase
MIEALPGDIFHRGQILNNTYEIEGVLGRGGTGEVYRAKNLISGRIVAVKALNAQFSGQEGYIELMRREEQMRDIRDDAVVRYTECSRSDQGHVFLVMDFIDGPSIADEMLRRRLEPRELMIIAHRVAEGLVAAHGQGIVHRDLSPDNVVLRGGSPEKATIIDFGIAKDTGAGARTIVGNDFAGKYEYAAPEQMEGKAEPRSDLYALGALLLAAWKGQVPFAGMTPGEMIRRKHEPLETAGVPEPLKGLIEWLSQPSLQKRAPSAAAVVEQVGKALKGTAPDRGRTTPTATRTDTTWSARPETAKRRAGGGLKAFLFIVLLGAAGGGAFYAGYLDRYLKEPLPVVSPYTLSAEPGGSLRVARLKAHAPDEASAQAIRAGFAALAGSEPAEDAVTLADGVPFPGWVNGAAALFGAVKGLEDWSIEVSDTAALVSGLAPSRDEGDAIRSGLKIWAGTHGFDLSEDVANGPKVLKSAIIQEVLDDAADCGAIRQLDPPPEGYPLGGLITVTGSAESSDLVRGLEAALIPLIGDRTLRFSMQTLNPQVCAIRRVLPPLPNNALSIWMGHGSSGEANLTGVFHVGDTPVVDILIPATIPEGRLWVMAVDTTGTIFNLLPNVNQGETDITRLGSVDNGMRRVRVLFSKAEKKLDTSLLAMEVTSDDFGKSEIIAFLTVDEMFEVRRARDESIASLVEDLEKIRLSLPGNVIGFTSRILETRP